MVSRICRFAMRSGNEPGERNVLGFDTGLDNQAFAQAKMAQFITQCGYLVFPDGRTEPWKAVGVTEQIINDSKFPTMVVWGPDFPGESLDNLVRDPERREESLDAIRFYLKARTIVENETELYFGASGALVNCGESRDFPWGTIMFPPERLVKRCIESGGETEVINAQQWVHPDFRGESQTVFCAAAMMYTVLTGETPFLPKDGDTLRQDIREGVYIPLRLAAPGLNSAIEGIITKSLEPEKKKTATDKRPGALQLLEVIGNPGSGGVASFFNPLDETEKQKIRGELEQFKKNKNFSVKTKRFVIRNTTILAVCLAVLVGVGLIINGQIRRLAEMPNTRGMTPADVAESYYGAFETMNHEMMEACVSGKKAKIDIDMILNLYVITRTRQAYEMDQITSLTAQQWLDLGSPQTNATVFGVTDLKLRTLGSDESRGEVVLEAGYKLWMPASFSGDDSDLPSDEEIMSGDFVNPPPRSYSYTDNLVLTWVKDSWRITEINRMVDR